MKSSSPLLLSAAAISCSLGSLYAQEIPSQHGTGETTYEAVGNLLNKHGSSDDISTTKLAKRGLPAVFPTIQELELGEGMSVVKDVQYIQSPIESIPAEGYQISLDASGTLKISYSSETGKFYALQTLSQLMGNIQAHTPVHQLNLIGAKLPVMNMIDAPDIAFRGVVEGFYGQPWSHTARLAQLDFYGRNKLNAYLYGPKDDVYHSRDWREPYPIGEAQKISQLVQRAKANHVKFYWAIHPGHNIKWNDEDMHKVIEKFELMYQLGVRHFAVFFDDISGEGTNPAMQAKLMDMIRREFVEQKGDVGELIMCPTQYNRAWSGGDYLELLGRELDKSIHIMWTGDTVVADITMASQEWINSKLQRPAFIWWNSPTTDYVRDHLCLGRVYGNEQTAQMRQSMSGFTSNPMDKPETSKIALFGVADYCWNIVNSNSNYSWLAGITRQFGPVAPAMMVFAQHNSDTGENYHKYRREESISIAPAIKLILQGAEAGHVNKEAWSKASLEFSALKRSCEKLQQSTLPAIEEIRPWIQAGQALGQAGEDILYTVCPSSDGSISGNLDYQLAYFVRASQAMTKMMILDKTENQNPYQPGIKVGSLVLTPMVNQLMERYDKLFMQAATKGQNKSMAAPAEASATSTIAGLEQLELIETKHGIAIKPSYETHSLPAGGRIEITLPAKPNASQLSLDLASAELPNWVKVQMKDSQNKLIDCEMRPLSHAHRFGFVRKGTPEEAQPDDARCMGVIITNTSQSPQEIKLTCVELDVEHKPSYLDSHSLRDGKLSTTMLITPDMVDKKLELPCPKNAKKVIIIGNIAGSISGLTKEKKTIDLADEKVQIKFDIKKGAKTMSFIPSRIGSINEIIFL
ncbi:MAG: beta-N-acetylglucosaminidase domain-containing protein [Akkermansia sp.]